MTGATSTGDDSWSVVVSIDGAWSIWRSDRPVPDGWSAQGFEGSERECLEFIEAEWTDLHPAALRARRG